MARATQVDGRCGPPAWVGLLFRIKGYEKLSPSTPRRRRSHCLLLWSMSLSKERVCPPTRMTVRVPPPSVLNDALDPPDHSKNAYSRDVLKGILISLAAVFVKASARLVACSAKALHLRLHELGLHAKHVLKVLRLAQLL